jgi:CheY-like chemotaxis protein
VLPRLTQAFLNIDTALQQLDFETLPALMTVADEEFDVFQQWLFDTTPSYLEHTAPKTLVQVCQKKPVKVLLVEDKIAISILASRELKRLGCEVVVASDGQAGLAAIKEGGYDIAFMDIGLPVMNGYTVTINAREWEKTQSTTMLPIIGFNPQPDRGGSKQCYSSGMQDVIVKPLFYDTVQVVLDRWVHEEGDAQLDVIFQEKARFAAESLVSGNIIDRAKLLDVSRSPEFTQELLALCLSDSFPEAEADFNVAKVSLDYPRLHAIALKLLGSALHCYLTNLTESLRNLLNALDSEHHHAVPLLLEMVLQDIKEAAEEIRSNG